jgi:hypothetical protein
VAFFNGEIRTTGWALFFPYCLLVKTPLPFFGLLALAAAGALRAQRIGGPGLRTLLYDSAPLTVFLAIYWTFALTSKLNIGQRHLLPTYPAMFILAGAVAFWLRPLARVPCFLAAGLMLAFVAESLLTWPNYLSYFNVLAGGPRNGYRHLVDSSLDWGQDLPGLKKWLQEQGLDAPTAPPVYLSYFGVADPDYYGICATRLPSVIEFKPHPVGPLTGGTYCVSATILQWAVKSPVCPAPWTGECESRYGRITALMERLSALHNDPSAQQELLRKHGFSQPGQAVEMFDQLRLGRLCAFLRQREPDDEVGYSILIYRLTDDDIKRALFPSTPAPIPRGK